MTAWNPSVVRVKSVEPHPNADKLDIVYVEGNPVVVTKGDYVVGDLAAYIPIDTIVPNTSTFDFMNPPKQVQKYDENGKQYTEVIGKKFPDGVIPESFRIVKAKKIRGVYSQGLLLKGYQHRYPGCVTFTSDWNNTHFSEGESITDCLRLAKWEEPEDDESKFSTTGNASRINSPWFKVPYYDIESANKFVTCFKSGEDVVIEEKLHGFNCAYTFSDKLWMKSRNLFKPEDGNPWHQIATKYHLAEKLAEYPLLTFFGEGYGNVKGFPYDTSNGELSIRFFDIYDIERSRFLSWEERNEILADVGLPPVPFLHRCNWSESFWESLKTIHGETSSQLNGNHIREGFVMRTATERYEPRLDSRMVVKYVSQQYNLGKMKLWKNSLSMLGI